MFPLSSSVPVGKPLASFGTETLSVLELEAGSGLKPGTFSHTLQLAAAPLNVHGPPSLAPPGVAF